MSAASSHRVFNYRPDIDGLRAIAVLSVILFHIESTILPGGFIGVDIFFVISGYLISLYVIRDLENERFSLLEFYRRRIKRIVPAMLVVVLATVVVTQMIFRPQDAEKVAESGMWALPAMANIYFWLHLDTSYFAPANNEMPLLHLWSLGVEEQFYILWPLILVLAHKAPSKMGVFVTGVLVAAASYLFGEYLFDYAPAFTYYMLPTRAGELLVGALAAITVVRFGHRNISGGLTQLAACSGLVLVAGSLVLLGKDQVYPGLRAIPPTVGTALIILAGHYGASMPNWLLATRPLVWVGLVSYSAYLWHWPILAVFRYGQREIDLVSGLVIFVLTLFIACVSYRVIELPARKSNRSVGHICVRQFLLPGGFIAVVAVAAMKVDGYGLRWLDGDYRSNLEVLRNDTRAANAYSSVCQRKRLVPEDITSRNCILGHSAPAQPKVLLLGDSNAAHYVGMLDIFAQEARFAFRNIAIEACPPIDSDPAAYVAAKRLVNCRESLKLAWDVIARYDVVVLAASWSYYEWEGEDFLDTLFDTVGNLASEGKLVVVLGMVPIISGYDRLCTEKALSYPALRCDFAASPLTREVLDVNAHLKVFSNNTENVEYYDVIDAICPGGLCSPFNQEGKPIYFDNSHLSFTGSLDIGRNIIRQQGLPVPFATIMTWLEGAAESPEF